MIDITASAVNAIISLGVTGATLWAAGRFLGEKLFGHWLEGRLQHQKQEYALDLEKFKGAQSVGLEQLKNEQNREIEQLRGDIGHLQDRGKHSNEREYDALAEIWEKFSDFHSATTDCVIAFVPFVNMQRMDEKEIAAFFDKNDFTAEERAAVQNAANKDDVLPRVVKVRLNAKARKAHTDFRAAFYKLNIFIPGPLTDEFDKAAGAYLSAVSQRELEARGAKLTGMKADQDFLNSGAFRTLNAAVRERLHRE